MFWNREKIEFCTEIPRSDATPLEAYWIAGEFDDGIEISNIFSAMIVQLFVKKIIKIRKKEECIIEFNYDNVDMFSSTYKKTMEDYSLLNEAKPMFKEEIGFFYNELMKLTESSKHLMDELKIGLDELTFLNLLKIVAFENEGKITTKLLYKTLMSRDIKSIKDMGVESILFFFSKLLPSVMFEKGFVVEDNLKLLDNANTKVTEKYQTESKLWKGLKKYLHKGLYDDLENLSAKTILDLLPYTIIFDCKDDLIENILLSSEGTFAADIVTIDTIDTLNKEFKILNNIMFA